MATVCFIMLGKRRVREVAINRILHIGPLRLVIYINACAAEKNAMIGHN